MAGRFTVRVGPVTTSMTSAAARAAETALVQAAAQGIVRRTQNRLRRGGSGALASELRSRGTGPRQALIEARRGGPGIIRPVTKQALFWPGARHPVKFVRGTGIEPLIQAEAKRLVESDLTPSQIDI